MAALVVATMMARHRRRRRVNWSTYISGAINIKVEFAGLTARTLAGSNLTQTVVDTARISSVKVTWAISDFTPGAGIGPFLVGWAHSNYSNSEVEGYLEAASSWDRGDLTSQEVRSRRVRIVGQINSPSSLNSTEFLNDGMPVKTKLNWILTEGDTLKAWIYNQGDGTVVTTTPNLTVFGTASIWQM